ncbi:MAG: hypothetical protein WBD20_12845 [Pirellulaceae bacterium]
MSITRTALLGMILISFALVSHASIPLQHRSLSPLDRSYQQSVRRMMKTTSEGKRIRSEFFARFGLQGRPTSYYENLEQEAEAKQREIQQRFHERYWQLQQLEESFRQNGR